jgi:hypothetical protein
LRNLEFSGEDWKRDERELERVIEERDLREAERRVPKVGKKKFTKVRFLKDMPEKLEEGELVFKKGDEKEVIDWIAFSWLEKGICERVEEEGK